MANTTYTVKKAKKVGEKAFYQEVGKLLIREGGKNGVLFSTIWTANSPCSCRSRATPRTPASSARERRGRWIAPAFHHQRVSG